MAEKKYYVVWQGRNPGIYDQWDQCLEQVKGFPAAQYKAFKSITEAQHAYRDLYANYVEHKDKTPLVDEKLRRRIGRPIEASICVDAAWNTSTGDVEYQGVDHQTGELLFHQGPYADGTNNIVEFLAIVHALGYCQQRKISMPIYSDSKTAISWVRDKTARTQHPRNIKNEPLFVLLDRAVTWLNTNTFENRILKWETAVWGEIPADFGRK